MLKKVIKYTDYNGNEREEEYLFHLSKGELIDMQMSEYGGLDKILQKIIDTKDQVKLWEYFKKIIFDSYGEKSLDGRNFVKVRDGKRLVDDFITTEAYSELMMELISDAEKAAAFVNGIIPDGVDASGNDKGNTEALPNLTPVK